MNLLDMRTIIIGHLLTNLLCTIVLAFVWAKNRKRFAGIDWWVLDFAFQTAAVTLVVLRGALPDWASMAVSNTLAVAGGLLGYIGLTLFFGRKGPQLHNYILLAAFALIHTYYVYIKPDLTARNLNLSFGLLIICFQCVWFLLRRVETEMRRITRGVGLVFAIFCLASLIRIAVILAAPSPNNNFFQSGLFDAIILMVYQLLLILLAFNLITMVNQRLLGDIQFQEKKYATAFHSSPYAITLTRLSDGKILDANDGFINISGYSHDETIGKSTLDLHLWVNEEDRADVADQLSQNGRASGREYQFRKKSGETIAGKFSAEVIRIHDQPWILSSVEDVTAQKRAEYALRESEGKIRAILDSMSEGVALNEIIYDENGKMVDYRILDVNQAFYSTADYIGDLVIGNVATKLYGMTPQIIQAFWETHKDKNEVERAEYLSPLKNRWFLISISPYFNDRFVTLFFDITARKQAEEELQTANEQLSLRLAEIERLHEELREQAIRDPLTGLYNRRVIQDMFKREFSRAKREEYSISVIMVDMDGLKTINDTYGHPAGDLAIQAVASRLQSMIRAEDVMCRYAGDEFVVLLNHTASHDAVKRVKQWQKFLNDHPIQAGGAAIPIRFTAGIASYPEQAETMEEALNYADVALYRAKARGRDRVGVFSS